MRLHCNFLNHGHESRLFVQQRKMNYDGVEEFPIVRKKQPIYSYYNRFITKFLTNQDYFFSNQNFSYEFDRNFFDSSGSFFPEVIIIHFFSGMITPDSVLELQRVTGAPVIWYLMDMAAFTGGCHYAWTCEGYRERCGNCPALTLRGANDRSRKVWEAKRAVLDRLNSAVVAGSSWLQSQSQRSSLFGGSPHRLVPVAVDPVVFSPGRRSAARKAMGIPEGQKLLMWGFGNLQEPRKGGAHALAALKHLKDRGGLGDGQSLVVTIGDPKIEETLRGLGVPNRHLGYLKGDTALADAYAAADAFLCPSIEDSGPMMINEALMCGTPVVAYRMGVAPDLVKTGETGYLATLGDVEDLSLGLSNILALTQQEAMEMSAQCRSLAENKCHPERQHAGFMELIHSLVPAAGPQRAPA